MVFEFLVVLIVSLLFGNGLLYFTSPKQSSAILSLKEQIQSEKTETQSEEAVDLSGSVYVDEIYSVQASLRSVNEKIKLAHERISDLENSLNSLGSLNVVLPSTQKENAFDAEAKIRNLENFKRNTKIELEAIKKLLIQLKEFRKIKGKKTLSTKKKEEEINKRIHELVFNTKKSD